MDSIWLYVAMLVLWAALTPAIGLSSRKNGKPLLRALANPLACVFFQIFLIANRLLGHQPGAAAKTTLLVLTVILWLAITVYAGYFAVLSARCIAWFVRFVRKQIDLSRI